MHLSFILILLGAFITRYFGYEGVMPIREGETENVFLSEKTYLTIFADGKIDGVLRRKRIENDLLLSENTKNKIRINDHFNGIPFSIDFESFRYKESEYPDCLNEQEENLNHRSNSQ